MIIPIPKNGPNVSQLERDICAYLKDFHFTYELHAGVLKGTKAISVQL